MVAKALLLADTEGSVRLWEADRTAASAAFRRLDELVAEAATTHQADRPLEQGEGDSFILVFADADTAVRAALELQLAIAKEPWPSNQQLKVRMALHAGDLDRKPDGRYAGHAFNRAARLRALAHGGQVLVTRAVADAAQPPTGASLKDLGEHRLRDLAKPERISQLTHPDLAQDFPPIRSLSALPNNLPPQLTTFVGRESEIQQIQRLLETSRLVTLTGAGGCGKTRLAIHVAAEASDRYRDGVWWVDLAPIADPALVPSTVAKVLGVRDDSTEDQTQTIEQATTDKSLLIVLDNCEHLVDATARLAERLAGNCTLLATSREPLGLAGEHAYRVPSLPAEQANTLFAERATKARPNFRLDDDTTQHVDEICKRLDGIPLAIELAAARTRMLSPRQIVKALEDRFHVLTGGARTALPRQRTLEASVDWSYQLLSQEEKQLLNRLSVFAGSFDLEAAEQICADDEDERYQTLDLLTSLADRSLVQVEHDQDRYRLLETIRVFARQKLSDAGEITNIRIRHLDHYMALAETAEPYLMLPQTAEEWLPRLEVEIDNIRAAMEWGLASGAPDKVLRLAGSMYTVWWRRGSLVETDRFVFSALDDPRGTDPIARLKGLMAAEALCFYGGEMRRAIGFGAEAVDIGVANGDLFRAARACVWLAWANLWTDAKNAEPYFQRGIELAQQSPFPAIRALFVYGVGFRKVVTGDTDEGLAVIREAVEIETEHAGPLRTGYPDIWLGLSLWIAGRLTESLEALRRGLAIVQPRKDLMFEQNALVGLVMNALSRGDDEARTAFMEQLRGIAGRSGFRLGERNIELMGGFVAAAEGDLQGALPVLEAAIEALRGFGATLAVDIALTWTADIRLAVGEPSRARALLEEARSNGMRVGEAFTEAAALVGLARVALATDSLAEAEERAHAALAASHGYFLIAVDALELIACASIDRGVYAARLFGAVSALRSSAAAAPLPYNAPLVSQYVERCRAALGASSFEEAFDEGASMSSFDEAVAFALRGRGARGRPTAGWASLTPAELSVVSLVAQGLTNPEIASRLLCSRNTVKAHLAHVFGKLGLSTRAELAAEATRRGL